MKLKSKLYLGFSSILFIIIILSVLMFNTLHILNDNTDKIVKDRYPKIKLANSIRNELNNAARQVRDIILSNDVDNLNQNISLVKKSLKAAEKEIIDLQQVTTNPELQEKLNKLRVLFDTYNGLVKEIINHIQRGDKPGAVHPKFPIFYI